METDGMKPECKGKQERTRERKTSDYQMKEHTGDTDSLKSGPQVAIVNGRDNVRKFEETFQVNGSGGAGDEGEATTTKAGIPATRYWGGATPINPAYRDNLPAGVKYTSDTTDSDSELEYVRHKGLPVGCETPPMSDESPPPAKWYIYDGVARDFQKDGRKEKSGEAVIIGDLISPVDHSVVACNGCATIH